jgi:Asp-tRNA(Asn)/Glu-tRNA(Gln) amidotransferase A subunit family amidase
MQMDRVDQLLRCDAISLAKCISSGEVSAETIVAASIARIEQIDPVINAVTNRLFGEAILRARQCDDSLGRGQLLGPLHGVPVLGKDLFDFQAGALNTFGSPRFARFVPGITVAHIARLQASGAVLVGRTNTPEFGHKGATDNRLFGPTGNPFDPGLNAGGSSGGSAAAVAAGMVPVALGSDAGGSIRIPAAWCGVLGFKPSFGRIPLTGSPNAFGSQTPFVHVGPLTRTVRDAALLCRILAGPHEADPFSLPNDSDAFAAEWSTTLTGRRIAFTPDFGVFPVERDVVECARHATGALADAGAVVEEPSFRLPVPHDQLAALWRRQVGAFYADFFDSLAEVGETVADAELPDPVLEMLEYGRRATVLDERRDQRLRTTIFHAFQAVFADYDLIASPTVACLPTPNASGGKTMGPETVAGTPVERCIGWCLTHPVNFTGHPAASVPAGLSRGLPVGLQIIGRRFADRSVLEAASVVESQRPWLPTLEQLWTRL